jgi:hypothetical protein
MIHQIKIPISMPSNICLFLYIQYLEFLIKQVLYKSLILFELSFMIYLIVLSSLVRKSTKVYLYGHSVKKYSQN